MFRFTPYLLLAVLADAQRTAHFRDYFYVGQSYVPSGSSSIAIGQMYVEHLTPASGTTQPFPLLFVHGAGMTGTNFLNTPDGREGWADWFMSKGYEIYLADQPARGRSSWQKDHDGHQSTFDTLMIESLLTAPARHERAKRFAPYAMAWQWNEAETVAKAQHALGELLDKIGPVVLITHSQSGSFGWPLADSRPTLVKAIVALEPRGPPFFGSALFSDSYRPYGITTVPITFSPPVSDPSEFQTVNVSTQSGQTCMTQKPPARQLPNLKDIPVLIVTAEASYHGDFDDCTVLFLREARVAVDFVKLQDVGIHGNGHMFFMEKNNLEIAEKVVEKWIMEAVGMPQSAYIPFFDLLRSGLGLKWI